MLSGSNKFQEYYYFAIHHRKRLAKMIELPNGIPSHDTMERTMHRVKSDHLNDLIVSFVSSLIGKGVIHLSIDGKFVRATREGLNKSDATIIVSAFLSNSKISVLSQQTKTKESNKNEIPVIKDLLTSLKEKFPNAKFMITIDTIAAVKPILSLLVSFGWDYAICTKRKGKTNGGFSVEIAEEFALAKDIKYLETTTNENGRDEIRKYYVIQDVSNLPSIDNW